MQNMIREFEKMDELTAKRLAVIRHLFEKGMDISFEGEPLNGLCLLPFHDSVEMFMKLCADVKGVTVSRDTMFAKYYDLLPDLQDKNQMLSLNARRVSLKHHGQMPSSLDVEITRVNVIDFYTHNVPVFFGCKLEEVSLEVLIVYPSVREFLRKFNEAFKEGKYGTAQSYCKMAFKEFLICYHEQRNRCLTLDDAPCKNARYLNKLNFEHNVDKYLEDLKEDVLKINEAITVMNLGINYFQYDEFMNHGFYMNYWPDEEGEKRYDCYVGDEANYDKEKIMKFYKFVMDNALRLQGKDMFA